MKDNSERLTLDVPAAGRLLGVSRVTAYQLVREGKLPVLRLGKRLVVPKVALERMLEEAGKPKESSESAKAGGLKV